MIFILVLLITQLRVKEISKLKLWSSYFTIFKQFFVIQIFRIFIMNAVKEGIQKLSLKKKKSSGKDKGSNPRLSEDDLDFIAEHTSINKEDVSET